MTTGNRGTGSWQQGRSGQQGPPRNPSGFGGGGGGRSGGESGGQFPRPTDVELSAIIKDGDARTLVQVAEQVGMALARPPDFRDQLTTSQIRAIFGAVREIEMNWHPDRADADRVRRSQRELLLLKPKLAYQARRAQGQGVAHLRQVLDPAIDLVDGNRERFQNLADFFEAILAYHRAHGGQ